MSVRALTTLAQNQVNNADIKIKFTLKVDGVDLSSYLISWSTEYSKEFGSAQATFVLNNNEDIFGDNGANKIEVGDVVELFESFLGDTYEYKKFYGLVNQRSRTKNASDRTIVLVCLDYISTLQFMDIDLIVEGEKIEVEEETLTPNYLPSPNDSMAQVFDFANNSLADNPLPIISIRNKNTAEEDPAYDGYEIIYNEGQLKLGFPLNALYNYDLIAIKYSYYVKGVFVEDIIEDILIEPDGYGKYLFGESTAQAVIDNHLTTTFLAETGTTNDYLFPNYTSSEITIEHTLTYDVAEGATSIILDSTDGLPDAGAGTINGDSFIWTSIESGNRLIGIPSTGSLALKDHKAGDYFEYTNTYPAGQVWYLTYSNVITDLISNHFNNLFGATLSYFDNRYGRIILSSPISTALTVVCNTNYTFKTLQASGIELNRIEFRSREIENRLDAIKKLREYLAPNYIIRTKGDNKIWANYLSQKVTEDYTLQLDTNMTFLEDEDLYTRVVFYGKNNNPYNLMFNEGVAFVGTGQSYKAIATASQLSSIREEGNYYVYGSPVSGVGKITTNSIKPIVYLNEVPIDNTSHLIAGQQVVVEVTTKTDTTTTSGGK